MICFEAFLNSRNECIAGVQFVSESQTINWYSSIQSQRAASQFQVGRPIIVHYAQFFDEWNRSF